MALRTTYAEAKWLKNLLLDLSISRQHILMVPIYYDCQETKVIVVNEIFKGKSKYVRPKHHFIWNLLDSSMIMIMNGWPPENLSDPMTKGISRTLAKKTS